MPIPNQFTLGQRVSVKASIDVEYFEAEDTASGETPYTNVRPGSKVIHIPFPGLYKAEAKKCLILETFPVSLELIVIGLQRKATGSYNEAHKGWSYDSDDYQQASLTPDRYWWFWKCVGTLNWHEPFLVRTEDMEAV